MNVVKQYALPIGLALVLILTAGLFYINNRGHDGSDNQLDESSEVTQKDQGATNDQKSQDVSDDTTSSKPDSTTALNVDESDSDFKFTAATGDSYTSFARYAVGVTASDLSDAQKVAAETFLTQQAGAPLLDIGNEVTITKGDVKAAVQRAQDLSSEQVAAWQVYVPLVDFSQV